MRSLYGYIRVSTREQNEDRQILALKELSIPEKHLFIDKQSGKDFERPQYPPLLQNLRIVTPQTVDALDIEQIVFF